MKALQQGNLDGTCGLYTAVNAVRAAASPYRKLSRAGYNELYVTFLEALESQTEGPVDLMTGGLSFKGMKSLLKTANVWLEANHELGLTYTKPYRQKDTPTILEWFMLVAEHLSTGGVAIIEIEYHEAHWTVLRELTPTSVILLDSAGMLKLNIDHLTMPDTTEGGAIWTIDPGHTLLVKCDPITAVKKGWGS
jgi:hypothetical protein